MKTSFLHYSYQSLFWVFCVTLLQGQSLSDSDHKRKYTQENKMRGYGKSIAQKVKNGIVIAAGSSLCLVGGMIINHESYGGQKGSRGYADDEAEELFPPVGIEKEISENIITHEGNKQVEFEEGAPYTKEEDNITRIYLNKSDVVTRLVKDAKCIEKKFPYYVDPIDEMRYAGYRYFVYDVEGKGDCWGLSSWIVSSDVLIFSDKAYDELPGNLDKVKEKVEDILQKHQEWHLQLTGALGELEDDQKKKIYLTAFQKAYNAYADHHKKTALSALQRGIAPGESSNPSIKNKKMKKVWKKLKPSWYSTLGWFPAIQNVKGREKQFREGIQNEIMTIGTVFGVKQDDKEYDFRLDYIRGVIETYQLFAKKVVLACLEFKYLACYFLNIVKVMRKGTTTIEDHKKWLKDHPKQLATIIRMVRLTTFFSKLSTDRSLSLSAIDILEKTTWGGMPIDFFKLVGITAKDGVEATVVTKKGEQYIISKLYENDIFLKRVLFLHVNGDHFRYAVMHPFPKKPSP